MKAPDRLPSQIPPHCLADIIRAIEALHKVTLAKDASK